MTKEQEAGMATAEICHRHGLSPATFYEVKAKYGGMDVSDARRLKALEDENGKLKRLLADAMLDQIPPPRGVGHRHCHCEAAYDTRRCRPAVIYRRAIAGIPIRRNDRTFWERWTGCHVRIHIRITLMNRLWFRRMAEIGRLE